MFRRNIASAYSPTCPCGRLESKNQQHTTQQQTNRRNLSAKGCLPLESNKNNQYHAVCGIFTRLEVLHFVIDLLQLTTPLGGQRE
jgi:hypothetical protein